MRSLAYFAKPFLASETRECAVQEYKFNWQSAQIQEGADKFVPSLPEKPPVYGYVHANNNR